MIGILTICLNSLGLHFALNQSCELKNTKKEIKMKKTINKSMKPSTKKSVSKIKKVFKKAQPSAPKSMAMKASTKKTTPQKAISKSKKIMTKKPSPLVDRVPMNQTSKAQEISPNQFSDTGSGVTSMIPTQVNGRPTSQQQFRNQSR